jgi:hypothetical protein
MVEDDSRNSPDQDASREDKAKAAASTAATGLGILAFVTLPFSILIIVGIFIAIAWVIYRMVTS